MNADNSHLNSKFDVLGVGLSVLDTILLLANYPKRNQKTVAIDSLVQSGGPVCNAVTAVAKLGGASSLLTVMGNDSAGQMVKKFLAKAGVDTSNIVYDDSSNTPQAYIWVDKKSGDRTIVLDSGKNRLPEPGEEKRNLLANSKVLLTDGRNLHLNLYLLKQAHNMEIITIMDAGSPRKGILEMLKFIDYFICSHDYSVQATGFTEPAKAIRVLQDIYPGTIVITLGKMGSIFSLNQNIKRMKALKVDALDTTGAGDVFHGAFARAIASFNGTWDFIQILKYSTAAASISCKKLGIHDSIPTHSEVIDKMMQIPDPFDS